MPNDSLVRGFLSALLVVLALGIEQGAVAGPYEDAEAAYKRSDYSIAATLLRTLAEKGNVKAQYKLGIMYQLGYGVARDYQEAVQWYRYSADRGDAGAQLSLGIMYNMGYGVARDYKEAVRWYRLSADQGDAAAQYVLGSKYRDGEGVGQDYLRAHVWFNLCAADGYSWAAAGERDELAKKMSSAQIVEAQALARKCRELKYRQCSLLMR
jgi:TPR repeat protein